MKNLKAILLMAATLVGVSTATAANTDCIPKSEIQAISKHFQQFSSHAGSDYCNDDSKDWHLLSSIMFMRQTQFAANMTPSTDDLFSGRFAKNWYDYFIGRIDELEVVSDCPKGVIAYVYAFGGKTMYTCPNALSSNFSALDRASVMMHEARHIDGYPHMTCTHGPRKGRQGACDRRIGDWGSYAVTVETYAQLAKYALGVHPAMKAYAKSSAVVYADEAFENQVRINRTQTMLLATNSLDFHTFNVQSGEVKKMGKVPAAGHILRRGQHLVIFPDDKNLKAEYVFFNNEGTIAQSPSDFVTEYNGWDANKKSELVDMHAGGVWSARIFKKSATVLCDPYDSNSARELTYPNGLTPANLLYPEGYSRETYSAQLLMTNGDIYDLGCANGQPRLAASFNKYDQKFKRVYKAGTQTFGLSFDGKLFRVESGKSTAISTNLNSPIIEMVPQETFEFFQ